MKKYWKILFGFTAVFGGLLGMYAFAGYAEYQMMAEVCSTLFHLPLLVLLPMLFAPRFGVFFGTAVKSVKEFYIVGFAVFALSLAVLFLPIPMIAEEWSIMRILVVTLFPAMFVELTFCIGVLWEKNRKYYDDTDVIVALQQLRGVWTYAVFVLAFALQSILIPRIGYPIDNDDQEFFWFVFIWFPAMFVHPIICAVLGWKIKSRYRISKERGLVFGFLVFFLFTGIFAIASWGMQPNLVYLILYNGAYWLLPAAITGIAFTAPLLFRKNKVTKI